MLHNIKYQEGVLKHTENENMINSYIFESLDRYGIKLPKQKYSITHHYVNGFYTKDSISNSFNAILLDLLEEDRIKVNDDIRYFGSHIKYVLSSVTNHMIKKSKRFEAGIHMKDLLDIQFDSRLIKQIKLFKESPSPKRVQLVYNAVKEVMNDPKNKSNNAAIFYLSNTVSPRQMNQVLGVIGYSSDTSNRIYGNPVYSNYFMGLRTMEEVSKESRGAAIALKNSSAAISDSESFAKKVQLVGSTLKNIVYKDCGSEIGIEFLVESAGVNDAGEDVPSSIKGIYGQYYKLKPEDKWKLVKKDDTHLEGKTIILRTTLSCKLSNKHSVCVKCYGNMGYHIAANHNVSYWSAGKITEPMNQSLLSTKHYLQSADAGVVRLDPNEDRVLMVRKGRDNNNKEANQDEFELKMKIDPKKYKEVLLILPTESVRGLKNIGSKDNISSKEIMNASKVKEFKIQTIDKNGKVTIIDVNLGRKNKYGVISKLLIAYAMNGNYEVLPREYHINITKFNKTHPIMIIPKVVFDYSEYNKSLRGLFSKEYENVEEMTKTLFRFINSKLYCHIAPIAAVAYTMTTKDKKNGDLSIDRSLDAKVTSTTTLSTSKNLTLSLASGSVNIFSSYMFNNKNDGHIVSSIFRPELVR